MKKYTFCVTGGSPYDGKIIIIAKTIKVAKRLADNVIKDYNRSNWCVHLTGEGVEVEPFDPPCVVHFESGEA